MYIEAKVGGVNPPSDADRQPIWTAKSGEDLVFTTRLRAPPKGINPATPSNSHILFSFSDGIFQPSIWEADWNDDNVIEVDDEEHPGLVSIRIPEEIAIELRRGVYFFSIAVSDVFQRHTQVQLSGSLLLDYVPTSPTTDIHYRKS